MKYLILTLCLSLGVFASSRETCLSNERPNLIFLLTDDQSSYTLGCYGNPDVKTPNIDQLARDGIAFDNHYDTTAICMASRANCMTGLLEYKNGTNFDHGPMMQDHWAQSYPVLLREAGYLIAFAGKFGFEVAPAPGDKAAMPEADFDHWGGAPGQSHYETERNKSMVKYADDYPHSTLSYAAFSRDVIADGAEKEVPFCLSISFKAAHRPVTPDPQFDDVYAGKTFTKPANYGRENGGHFSEQSKQGRQYVRFEEWGYADNYDEVMAKYHQQIYGVDVAVGMIREALEEHGVADNTVIIFTSDNGFFCGSHGYGSKVLPYEDSSCVPLIMFDPRHENSGKELRSEALTGNIDFAPTLLELAGVEIPENIDGKSLLPLYDNPEAVTHESLPLINAWGTQACQALGVVTKDFKYIFWNYGEGDFEPVEELYHLRKDPLELTNAVDNPEYESQLESLRATYDTVVADWKENAVPYNDYQKYAVLFDRNLEWSEKSNALKAKKTKEKKTK
ncbi:MAG: sulfatase [Verrucomicrobiota bacterium]